MASTIKTFNDINQEDLLQRMLWATEINIGDVVDATIEGSFLHGTQTEKSDIDTHIWIDGGVKKIYHVSYHGRNLCIKVKPFSEVATPFASKYVLPKMSLITGHIYDKNDNDLEKYNKDRRRS